MRKLFYSVVSPSLLGASMLISASALAACMDRVVEQVMNVCHAPGRAGKHWDVTIGGGGQASVKFKKIIEGGVNAEAKFTKNEWDGVQRVLREQQAADNSNYRECARNLVPIFQTAVCQVSAVSNTSRRQDSRSTRTDDLAINYARLFGAYQVPFYLLDDSGQKYMSQGVLFIERPSNAARIRRFQESWEYRDAKGIKNIVWNELFSGQNNDLECNRLLLNANSGDPLGEWYIRYCSDENRSEVVRQYLSTKYKKRWDANEFEFGSPDGEIEYYFEAKNAPAKPREIIKRIEANSSNVGFLVLYVQNMSGKHLFDVKIESQILNRVSIDNNESMNSINEKLKALHIDISDIPLVKAGEKIFLLLSIYHADRSGYPGSYLSSIVHPVRITYRMQGSSDRHVMRVREPLRDQAARFVMPFGWYGQ